MAQRAAVTGNGSLQFARTGISPALSENVAGTWTPYTVLFSYRPPVGGGFILDLAFSAWRIGHYDAKILFQHPDIDGGEFVVLEAADLPEGVPGDYVTHIWVDVLGGPDGSGYLCVINVYRLVDGIDTTWTLAGTVNTTNTYVDTIQAVSTDPDLRGELSTLKVWTGTKLGADLFDETQTDSLIDSTNVYFYSRFEDATTAHLDIDGAAHNLTPTGSTTGATTASNRSALYPADDAQTISPSGIASAEAFGSATVSPGAVNISPTGIASAEAFGSATVQPGSVQISPSGIGSAEAFGNPTVSPGAVNVSPTGIASQEAFGTPTVTPGAVTVAPAGIASAEAFGQPTLTPGEVSVSPTGIASAEQFGSPTVTLAGDATIEPQGIESAEAFGTPRVVVHTMPPADRVMAALLDDTFLSADPGDTWMDVAV